MQYTINEITGGQIKVTFADSSYAYVRIQSDDTPERIDERVGQFTTEYVVAETANPNISVGEVRNTVDPVAAREARLAAEVAAANAAAQAAIEDPYSMNWGNTARYMSTATAYALAQKLAADGDCSFLHMINARLQTIQDDADFDLNTLKQYFNDAYIV